MNEKNYPSKRFAIIFLIGALSIQCGSFQGVSYYDLTAYTTAAVISRTASNSLHDSQFLSRRKTAPASTGGSYYENYFQNLSDEYASTPPPMIYS